MRAPAESPVRIELPGCDAVSGVWVAPARARACLVLAHGAGAGMTHRFMAAAAHALARHAIATLRYNFPSMDKGMARPDPPPVAHATVRAAVAAAAERAEELPLFAGGKSFGGRMTSQAEALGALPGVRGLVFLGFPLHPAGKPSVARADHLREVRLPMLFLQGDRDALAEISLLTSTVAGLGGRATLRVTPGADHAFHVPARSGRTDAQVLDELAEAAADWMARQTPR